MTITNNWTVDQMECRPDVDGKKNVVFRVYWRLNSTDGTFVSGVYGTADIPLGPDRFVAYNRLTESQVIGWVKASLGADQVAVYEGVTAADIANQASPNVVTLPIPWSQS